MTKKTWIMIVCCAAAAITCTAALAEKAEKSLPAAIEAAVKTLFPSAVVEKTEREEEEVMTYEVKLKDGKKESEVKLTEDGMLVEEETIETIDAVPPAVAEAIKTQGGEIKKIEKTVEYAQLKVVKLDTPTTKYEAKIVKDGKETEIEMNADGSITKVEAEENEENDKD